MLIVVVRQHCLSLPHGTFSIIWSLFWLVRRRVQQSLFVLRRRTIVATSNRRHSRHRRCRHGHNARACGCCLGGHVQQRNQRRCHHPARGTVATTSNRLRRCASAAAATAAAAQCLQRRLYVRYGSGIVVPVFLLLCHARRGGACFCRCQAGTWAGAGRGLLEPSKTGTYVKYPYRGLHGSSTLVMLPT